MPHHKFVQVTVSYAKANLPELLQVVEAGETVEITRYNRPVARLVPYRTAQSKGPKLGTAPKSVKIVDPNWAEPIEPANLSGKGLK